jgi:two-component system sensor histidine kinase/response regulator
VPPRLTSKALVEQLKTAFGSADAGDLKALIEGAAAGRKAALDVSARFARFLTLVDQQYAAAEAGPSSVPPQDTSSQARAIQSLQSAVFQLTGKLWTVDMRFPGHALERLSAVMAELAQKRIEAEQAARVREAETRRLAQIAARTHSAVVITDRAGAIEWVNAGFTRLTGYQPDEVLGRTPGSFLQRTDSDPNSVKVMSEAVAEGRGFKVEMVNYGKDGRRYWVSIDAEPMRNEADEVTGFMAIQADITERKKTELALHDAKTAAEGARDSAERALRAKSEFLANMSHEIRTPMNGVLGLTELLIETELSQSQRRYAENIRASAEALVAIINDILDFSKIEAGKLKLDPSPFDLHREVESATEVLAARAHARGLELSCFIEGAVPRGVIGDGGRLRQILLNLIGNAVKFTERGEVSVTVRRARRHEGDPRMRIRFSVHDTGIGVSEEVRELLFQPFVQADGSTTRRFGGTGLGLAISRQLISMMEGDIGVESSVGTGSIFWIEVPFAIDESVVAPPERPFAGHRALIVEPHATQAVILKHYLQELGFEPEWVVDGNDAPVRLRSASAEGRPFRLAMVDMRTAGVHPSDIVRRLADRITPPETRLVLISPVVAAWEAEEARQSGFAAVVHKPLRREELRQALTQALAAPANAPAKQASAVAPDKRSTVEVESHKGSPALAPAAPQAPIRVLLVEDNPINQFIARVILEQHGCAVTVAEDGLQGLKNYQSSKFELILMDCQMPRLDGYMATREIRDIERQNPARPRTPVVALTANAMPGDKEKCLDAGMDDYLAKPFTKKALSDVLNRWVRPTAEAGGDSSRAVEVS